MICHHANGAYETYINNDKQEKKQASAHINKLALEQVQQCFPGDIDVLRHNQFEFEIKHFFNRVVFHGVANYCGDGEVISMRSYEQNKDHYTVKFCADKLIKDDFYDHKTPAEYFLLASDKNPARIDRSHSFLKNAILKLKKYCHDYLPDSGKPSIITPGQSILVVGLLREHSLSQHTFKTIAQFKAIFKQRQKLIGAYEQGFEAYFTEEGILLNEKMIHTLHNLIRSGCDDITTILDPHRHIHRQTSLEHPQAPIIRLLRERLKMWLHVQNPSIDNTVIYVDEDDFASDSFRMRADD
jgi:hypothetical protein